MIVETGPGGHLLRNNSLGDVLSVTTAQTNLGIIDANGAMVGGLVQHAFTPSSSTTVTNTTVTLSPTVTFSAISGEKYLVMIHGAGQVTTGSPTYVNMQATCSSDSITGSPFVFSAQNPANTTVSAATLVGLVVASATGTETITITATAVGAGTTMTVSQNIVEVDVVRVA